MVKAAIFDFDGTLANTLPDLTTGINLMHAHYHVPPITQEDVLRFINGSTREFIENSMPADFPREYIDEATNIYIQGYTKHYLDETKPFAGVRELVERLHGEGVKLAVFSNKDNVSLRNMVQTLFPNVFDMVWGTVDGIPVKPDPTRAGMIASDFGLSPEEIAYIGDSDVDMITACRANMMPIAVLWGYRDEKTLLNCGARKVAHDADELYALLSRM